MCNMKYLWKIISHYSNGNFLLLTLKKKYQYDKKFFSSFFGICINLKVSLVNWHKQRIYFALTFREFMEANMKVHRGKRAEKNSNIYL